MKNTMKIALGAVVAASLLTLSIVLPPQQEARALNSFCVGTLVVCLASIDAARVYATEFAPGEFNLTLNVVGTDREGGAVNESFVYTPTGDASRDEILMESWKSCRSFARKGQTNKKVDFYYNTSFSSDDPLCGNVPVE